MEDSDDTRESIKPTEQRGGSTPGEREARQKGPWAATAGDGLVPAELGGSDAPPELRPEDPELGSSVLGATTGSDTPANESGIDLRAGDNADATADGGPTPPAGHEPDLKDAGAGPRQPDSESAG